MREAEEQQGAHPIKDECKRSIMRVAELSSDDFHLDRYLYFSCREDRERFCEKVRNVLQLHRFTLPLESTRGRRLYSDERRPASIHLLPVWVLESKRPVRFTSFGSFKLDWCIFYHLVSSSDAGRRGTSLQMSLQSQVRGGDDGEGECDGRHG